MSRYSNDEELCQARPTVPVKKLNPELKPSEKKIEEFSVPQRAKTLFYGGKEYYIDLERSKSSNSYFREGKQKEQNSTSEPQIHVIDWKNKSSNGIDKNDDVSSGKAEDKFLQESCIKDNISADRNMSFPRQNLSGERQDSSPKEENKDAKKTAVEPETHSPPCIDVISPLSDDRSFFHQGEAQYSFPLDLSSPKIESFCGSSVTHDSNNNILTSNTKTEEEKIDLTSSDGNYSPNIKRQRKSSWWSRNKHMIGYGTLVLLIAFLIAGLVSSVVIMARGTRTMVDTYFNRLDQKSRLKLFDQLFSKYWAIDDDKNIVNRGLRQQSFPRERYSHKKGSNMGGYNKASGFSSKYQKDEKLMSLIKNNQGLGPIFYGVAYSPSNSMEPLCGVSKRDIELDLATLSTVTSRLRTYGMQCNQTRLILQTIQEMGLNMTLAMGVWISLVDSLNESQMSEMKRVLEEFPRGLFDSIYIGNEVLFREEKTSTSLSEYVNEARAYVNKLGYNDLPVGTSEQASFIDKTLLKNCDLVGVNIHPFFSGENSETATKWVFDFLKYQIEPLNEEKGAELVITEIGWPYKGGGYKASVANSTNFSSFLNEWVCEASKKDYAWYYFEGFDEPWKTIFYEDENSWETEWGIFTKERKPKQNVKIPRCEF